MSRQLTMQSSVSPRLGPWWVAFPALAAAAAALVIPGGSSSPTTAEATVLAVGGIAFLAGHTWGLLVMTPSQVALVGHLWPGLAQIGPHGHAAIPGGDLGTAAAAIVLVASLPILALTVILLPAMVRWLAYDRSPRTQAFCVTGVALLLLAALIAPAL